MRKILLLVTLLVGSIAARSQNAANYCFSAFSGTYTAITGTAVGINSDDVTQTGIPFNFNFTFCGVVYTQASVCSNGFLSFANTTNNTLTNDLTTLSQITPAVMPLWDDLSGSGTTTSTPVYATTGTAPNRIFTMQWGGWLWNFSGGTNGISFQVKLFETTNVIQFVYSQGPGALNLPSATIGIARNATDWQTLNSATATPVSSSTLFTTGIATKPPTGQIYQYSPPTTCTGTPTGSITGGGSVCPNSAFTINSSLGCAGGLTYQWYSAPGGSSSFSPIAGATSQNYTSTGITAATDYRLVVTCSASTQSLTTNTVSYTVNPTYLCNPCIPTYLFGGGSDNITNVAVGTLNNNTAAAGNPSPYYTSYVNQQPNPIPIPGIIIGSPTTVAVSFGSDGNQYSRIWIDWNRDNTFSTTTSPNESWPVGTGTNAGANGTANIVVTIPTTATPGLALMRIRGGDDVAVPITAPCGASPSSFGEAEDYLVNLLSPIPPAPVLTSNSPICQGTALTITATIPTGYPSVTYTIKGPGWPVAGTTNTTGIFTVAAPTAAYTGTDTVTVTTNGFTSSATISIIVYPNPTITLGTIIQPTTCGSATGSIQINGLTASTLYDSVRFRKGGVQVTPIGFTSNTSGSYTITGLTQGTYDSIRVKTVNGCFTNILGPVTLADPNPPAAPVITPGFPRCNGTTLSLAITSSGTAYPATGIVYNVTAPGGAVSNTNPATFANFTTANNGSFCAYVVVNGCTSPTTCTNITVTAASAPPTVTNPSYCQGEFALPLINSVTGVNDSIYTTLTGGNALPYSFVPPTAVAGTDTFFVTQSNPCPNIPRTKIWVITKPRPLPPVSTSPTSYCQYEIAQPLTAQGTALLWYTTATGGASSTTAPTPVTTVPGTYNFYVSQTVNGCEGARTTITVTIKPKPAPPGVTSPLQLCQNDPPSPLTAQGQGLRWYTTPTGGVGLTQAPVPNVGFEDSFFYYVSQTVNGCESDRARIKVVVNYRPNGIILATRPWVCAEDTVSFQYFGNGRTDAIYNWHTPHPQTDIISGDHTQGPLVVEFNTPGTQVVTLQVNNRGCLSPVLKASVMVRPLPTATFVHSKDDICTDQVVNIALSHISGNISDYNWTGFDGATVAYGTYNGGPFGLSWSQPGEHVVTLVVTSNECNSHPITDTVVVHPYPDATIHHISNDAINICASDSVELSVIPGVDPATYAWTPAAYFYNRSDSSATVYAQPKYTGRVAVTVTSIYGCAAKDSIDITTKPCCGVTFPTAFAPGDPDRNNRFRPITVGHHEVLSFRVINRWGVVVYESRDERQGWDGRYNGQPQDMGQFYYYFRYKCVDGQDLEEKGEVLLMR